MALLSGRVIDTLGSAGIALAQVLAEYGHGQFGIPAQPADPQTAADRTVPTLKTIRDTVRGMGLRASVLAKPALDQIGNGVHMHFSRWDGARIVTCEADWLTAQPSWPG